MILSSSSLLLSMDPRWDVWHDMLSKCGAHVVLFDMKPSSYIDKMAIQFEVIEYAKFQLDGYTFICLIAKDVQATSIYFMPCSELLANIIVEFLSSKPYAQIYHYNENDNNELNIVLRHGMSHLIHESIFDFRSLNTHYALRCFYKN